MSANVTAENSRFLFPMVVTALAAMATLQSGTAWAGDGIFDLINRWSKGVADASRNSSQGTAPSPNRSSGPITRTSQYQFQGVVPDNARWLMVSTQKQGQNENTLVVAVKPRTAFPPIGLLDGPGLYTLKIFYSNAMKIADPSYKFIAEAQVQNVDDRDMTNLLPSVLVQSTAPEIVRISDQVTQDKSSTRERAVALHDWVANNVSYDSDSVRTNTTDLLALDALSVLENPWTICEGYSNLFAALTRAAGIRTKLIKGKVFGDGIPTQYSTEELCKDNVEAQANHSWNELLIDGRWVSVDVTWDSGFSRNNTNANFEHTPGKLTYFDQDANEFQKTHLKCSEWNK